MLTFIPSITVTKVPTKIRTSIPTPRSTAIQPPTLVPTLIPSIAIPTAISHSDQSVAAVYTHVTVSVAQVLANVSVPAGMDEYPTQFQATFVGIIDGILIVNGIPTSGVLIYNTTSSTVLTNTTSIYALTVEYGVISILEETPYTTVDALLAAIARALKDYTKEIFMGLQESNVTGMINVYSVSLPVMIVTSVEVTSVNDDDNTNSYSNKGTKVSGFVSVTNTVIVSIVVPAIVVSYC